MTEAAVGAASLDLAPDGSLSLHCAFPDRERAKWVAGWRWHASSKAWRYLCNADTVAALGKTFPGLRVHSAVAEAVRRSAEAAADLRGLRGASEIEGDWPVRIPLYLHQRRAAAMAVRAPAFANLMEMGTGKTAAKIGRASCRERVLFRV